MRYQWTHEQSHRHHDSLRRELGDVVLEGLSDDNVTEIMRNPDGELWLDTHSGGLVATGRSMTDEQAWSLISTVAGLLDRVVGEKAPVLEAELPLDGSRIEALLPPLAESPIFAIRKRATALYPLERYLEEGSVTRAQADALQAALRERWNLVVSGGPGSGKTTFINALLHEMVELAPATERFVILEDTYELRCDAPNHVILHTSDEVDLRALVRATLRLRPDRILVGEVRGAEAHDLLKAWNTGNPGGCASVHANGAVDALERLDQLAQEAGVPSQARLIAATVDLVAHLERRGNRRVLRQLIAVRGHDPRRGFDVESLAASPLTEETAP